MADSNPSIVSASIPTEAQPNNRFTFDVKVRQGGPDPWFSEDACAAGLDIRGWKTPIKLFANGEEVDSQELCLVSGNTGETTLSASLSRGSHILKVSVYEVGGFAYDFTEGGEHENDSSSQTVTVTDKATDPSKPNATDRVTEFLSSVASALGGTTQQVAFGMVLAVVLLMVI